MRAVAHGWRPDRIDAPPVGVAKEFTEADKHKNAARLSHKGPNT